MKELAIIYRSMCNPAAIEYLENNFYSVLGDYVNITNYYMNEVDADEMIEADAYVICYEDILSSLVGHIDDFSKVVVMTRSIQQKYLHPVMEIPAGTRVLVVNDSRQSILQTIYMIYELGIGHLMLIPFDENLAASGGYDDIDTAIVTTDSKPLVPKHIAHIYNIYNREISFETFHKVISLLGLQNSYVHGNLLKKIKDDMDTSIDYINSYMSSFLKDQMLNNVVDGSSQAIILLDSRGTVHYVNEQAAFTFGIEPNDIFVQNQYLPETLASSDAFENEMVVFKEGNYLVKKINISLLDESIGCCLIFQNEKDLRESENHLSRKLKQSGFYARYTFNDMIHQSPPMQQCISMAKKAALSDYTILIRGASGTGKELLAQSIHNYSPRRKYPFVAVNCGAIPDSLLESELFGYEEGSFTGAKKSGKLGLFEHAQHGTIFLDEIGDISSSLQTRLLRVIQERQIMRVGSGKIIDIDVRIIAATNADLEKRVSEGKFRSDLFYRLNVITLNLAPLKDRKADILPLLKVFLGKKYNNLLPKEQEALLRYSWPGNVRELENAASYYRIMGQLPEYLPAGTSAEPDYIKSDDCFGAVFQNDDMAGKDYIMKKILKIILSESTPYVGIGRGAILQSLYKENINIGEGLLKKYMAELKKNGLIHTGTGRTGSRITREGLLYIEGEKS